MSVSRYRGGRATVECLEIDLGPYWAELLAVELVHLRNLRRTSWRRLDDLQDAIPVHVKEARLEQPRERVPKRGKERGKGVKSVLDSSLQAVPDLVESSRHRASLPQLVLRPADHTADRGVGGHPEKPRDGRQLHPREATTSIHRQGSWLVPPPPPTLE